MQDHFTKHFDYGSFLPSFLIIIGIYTIFLFIQENFEVGFFFMIIGFLLYVINNVLINVKGFTTVFNEYLEDMSALIAFGLTTIIFGIIFFQEDLFTLALVFFYGVCIILGLARNWIVRLKNSMGWPLPLTGLFFPFLYYLYSIYLQNHGQSIFLIYFILVGILSISKHNFLGYDETKEKFRVVDERYLEKKKLKNL